jgi:hypothetical protein
MKRKDKKMATNGSEEKQEALILAPEKSEDVQKFELQQRMARLFAKSGLFADVKGMNEEQAIAAVFVKIALGDSMGLSAAESVTGIDIIQGRVAIGANIRAARMQRAGFDWNVLRHDNDGCWLAIKKDGVQLLREDGQPAIVAFTLDDAKRADLISKSNWQKFKLEMYFARAITRAQRWYAPGVLGVSILSKEEIESDPDFHAAEAKPKIVEKAKASLDEVKKKYERPPKEAPSTAGAGTSPEAATKPRPEAGKVDVAEKSTLRGEGTLQPPPASKLTQQLKQSINNEKAKVQPPEELFGPEDAW